MTIEAVIFAELTRVVARIVPVVISTAKRLPMEPFVKCNPEMVAFVLVKLLAVKAEINALEDVKFVLFMLVTNILLDVISVLIIFAIVLFVIFAFVRNEFVAVTFVKREFAAVRAWTLMFDTAKEPTVTDPDKTAFPPT